MWAISLGLASWYDTWISSIVIGRSTVGIATLVILQMKGTRLSRCVIAAALMVLVALQNCALGITVIYNFYLLYFQPLQFFNSESRLETYMQSPEYNDYANKY